MADFIGKTGVHWFRQGLRLHDNPALYECADECDRIVPIFIFDGKSSGTDICGFIRYRFLLQSLKDLEKQFAAYGIKFMCFYGEPHEVIERLIQEWKIDVLSFEKDTESIWKTRDDLVKNVCDKYKVEVIERVSHTLYDPIEIFNINDNKPPNTCEDMRKYFLRMGDPPTETPLPNLRNASQEPSEIIYDPNLHKVPDIERFGIKPECPEQEQIMFIGGETRALELWKERLAYEIDAFKEGLVNPNLNKPVLFKKEISLSPYLRFGCISVRKFYYDVKKAFQKYFNGPKNVDEFCPYDQIFWREYFYTLSHKNHNFAKLEKNPMSFQIKWDCAFDPLECEKKFVKWEKGITGFPWIDACMRQLIYEGWIHHVCRNSLAIFLTRGDLFISWEKGMNSFFKYLVDGDWSVNAGNWNWISCGDPDEIIKRESTFCPVKHSKKLDPNGTYIRKYVKELRNFPTKYIFEPWKAPHSVQEEAGCIIGKDYPEPMIDHEEAYEENQEKLRKFFKAEKREIFEKFLCDSTVLKSACLEEFRSYLCYKYLESIEMDNNIQLNKNHFI